MEFIDCGDMNIDDTIPLKEEIKKEVEMTGKHGHQLDIFCADHEIKEETVTGPVAPQKSTDAKPGNLSSGYVCLTIQLENFINDPTNDTPVNPKISFDNKTRKRKGRPRKITRDSLTEEEILPEPSNKTPEISENSSENKTVKRNKRVCPKIEERKIQIREASQIYRENRPERQRKTIPRYTEDPEDHVAQNTTMNPHRKAVEQKTEKNLEANRKAVARYIAKNPEVHRRAVARYTAKNPEVHRKAAARYAAKNPEVNRRAVARYKAKHPEVNRRAVARYRNRLKLLKAAAASNTTCSDLTNISPKIEVEIPALPSDCLITYSPKSADAICIDKEASNSLSVTGVPKIEVEIPAAR